MHRIQMRIIYNIRISYIWSLYQEDEEEPQVHMYIHTINNPPKYNQIFNLNLQIM
jgi:hypothetical protein